MTGGPPAPNRPFSTPATRPVGTASQRGRSRSRRAGRRRNTRPTATRNQPSTVMARRVSVVCSSRVPTGMPTATPAPIRAMGRQRTWRRARQLMVSSVGRFTSSSRTTGSFRSGKISASRPSATRPEPNPNSTYTSWASTSTPQVRAYCTGPVKTVAGTGAPGRKGAADGDADDRRGTPEAGRGMMPRPAPTGKIAVRATSRASRPRRAVLVRLQPGGFADRAGPGRRPARPASPCRAPRRPRRRPPPPDRPGRLSFAQ